MDGGGGQCMCSMPLNRTLKNGENVNFMLCLVLYHDVVLEFYFYLFFVGGF